MTTLPHGALDPKTREEIAQVEIGHTTVTPAVARSMFAVFLLICCSIPVLELTRAVGGDTGALQPWARMQAIPGQTSTSWQSADRGDGASVLKRAWRGLIAANRAVLEGLHEFEKSLEDESRLAGSLRPGAQQLLSGRLGAGNEQAYVGRDGWLFYRPDVEFVTGRGFLAEDVRQRRIRTVAEWTAPPEPDPRPAIIQLHRDLESRGIALILVPVPVKPTIHGELLATGAARAGERPQNPDYDRFVQEIRGAGVTVFDPVDPLEQARQTSGASQYLATDTHWRPEAMEMVVGLLADVVRKRVRLPDVPDPGYLTSSTDISQRGDVFGMLDLPERQSLFPPETATIRQIRQADESSWRPAADADVLLLGDSFANIYSLESMGWGTSAGMAEQLSRALGRPVDRMVQNDAGSFATREMLARAEPQRLAPKRVVIYQFAARELAFGDWKRLPLPAR